MRGTVYRGRGGFGQSNITTIITAARWSNPS